jgi:UDP:flavonoid glycosyltransferase YjiC (YdhE family)
VTRLLLTTMPIPGHVNPMLPIAGELVRRGHEVGWYTGAAFRGAVESSGARWLPIEAGRDLDLTDPAVLPGRHGKRGVAQLAYYLRHLLLDSAPGQVADLERILAAFPARAVLSDVTFLGALYLAERGGPPVAVLGATAYPGISRDTAPYGLGLAPASGGLGRLRNRLLNHLVYRVLFAGVNAYADRVRAGLGLAPTPFPFIDTAPRLADLYLQATAESFEYRRADLPAKVRFIGALLHRPPAPAELPPWWGELAAGRPVVHVTQGTIATDHRRLMVPAIEGLAGEDVLVVAATGGSPVADFPLSPLPANVRLERFVPYHALLPLTDAIVTNAGYGGVQFALSHGVPLVAAGTTEDKREISARIRWAGVGVAFGTDSPRPAAIRRAVRRVLDDPSYAAAARRVRADFARHHAAAEAADLVEELAAAGGARPGGVDRFRMTRRPAVGRRIG